MKLVLIGPQGSGKGTQAKLLAAKLGVAHISTGDLLRGATGELKKEVEQFTLNGKLVPNEIIQKVMKERLANDDCSKGFILDGFPRSLSQADILDSLSEIDYFIEINISDEGAVQRLSGRVSCEKCGAGYNTVTMPPKEKGKCDKCGGKLIQRADDTEEAIKERLAIYHSETEPLKKRYSFVRVDGEKSVEEVQAEILKALNI